MKIVYKALKDLKPYENNPRKNAKAVAGVAESIRQFGFRVPIVIDKNNVIICGHTRYKAAKKLKMKEVPTICPDLSEEQARAFRIVDNKVGEFSKWDDEMLMEEISELIPTFKMGVFGFKLDDDDKSNYDTVGDDFTEESTRAGRLQAEITPASVFDSTSEYKKLYEHYQELGILSDSGRTGDLLGKGKEDLADKLGYDSLSGTSVFNPVLCHCMYKWFNRKGGLVFDPFSGGYTRGIVAAHLGYNYLGIDLRQEQVDANRAKADELDLSATWVCDDSLNADLYLENETADMVLTSPPYYDLEVYSDDPQDLSNMKPEDFLDTYKRILEKAYNKLKNNSFFVVVVAEVRDKKGYYRRFVLDTIDICKSLGMNFWNEIILCNFVGQKTVTARRPFAMNRKTAAIHQNCLVFYKGNPQEIAENWEGVEL